MGPRMRYTRLLMEQLSSHRGDGPAAERDALATLFAVKDRFTVLDLGMAPWGYGEDDLAKALKSGAVNDLDYWRRLDYEPPKRKPKAPKKKKVGASGRNKKKAAKSRAFG